MLRAQAFVLLWGSHLYAIYANSTLFNVRNGSLNSGLFWVTWNVKYAACYNGIHFPGATIAWAADLNTSSSYETSSESSTS